MAMVSIFQGATRRAYSNKWIDGYKMHQEEWSSRTGRAGQYGHRKTGFSAYQCNSSSFPCQSYWLLPDPGREAGRTEGAIRSEMKRGRLCKNDDDEDDDFDDEKLEVCWSLVFFSCLLLLHLFLFFFFCQKFNLPFRNTFALRWSLLQEGTC